MDGKAGGGGGRVRVQVTPTPSWLQANGGRGSGRIIGPRRRASIARPHPASPCTPLLRVEACRAMWTRVARGSRTAGDSGKVRSAREVSLGLHTAVRAVHQLDQNECAIIAAAPRSVVLGRARRRGRRHHETLGRRRTHGCVRQARQSAFGQGSRQTVCTLTQARVHLCACVP